MAGEGPPPLALRKFLLAAGYGEIGGLGALAVYGPYPLLGYAEFNEAWAMQQVAAERLSQASGSDEARRSSGVRRAIALDKKGVIDQMDATPDAQRPAWIPADPMDPSFDPYSVEDQMQQSLNRPGWSGIS